jgi:arylsulfatase A-like enzyme
LGAVSQLDVTPTILSLMGLPAAKDMPGQSWVPETVPRVDSYRALAPGGAEREEPVDRERLRSLGYVD